MPDATAKQLGFKLILSFVIECSIRGASVLRIVWLVYAYTVKQAVKCLGFFFEVHHVHYARERKGLMFNTSSSSEGGIMQIQIQLQMQIRSRLPLPPSLTRTLIC